jgi:hypothetical protein
MEADRGITIASPNLQSVADLYRQVGVGMSTMACSALSRLRRAPSRFFKTGSPRSPLISFSPISRTRRSFRVLLTTVDYTNSIQGKQDKGSAVYDKQ